MAAKRPRFNAVPVSELVSGIIDPVLARRAGMTTGLIEAWDEIVGEQIGARSRPERIRWGRRATAEDPFEPATLVIACDGASALKVQHMADEIVARANAFLGFGAIGRVRIVQKPVSAMPPPNRAPARPLSVNEKERIAKCVASVDDEPLREALARLGENVAARRRS